MSRLSAHFAFDTLTLSLAYWAGEAKRVRSHGDAASPYLLPPHYYEIEMASPVKAPMVVADWVFRLIEHGADPALRSKSTGRLTLHGESGSIWAAR